MRRTVWRCIGKSPATAARILVIGIGVLLLSAPGGHAATTSGTISADEVWSGTIDITGDVTVAQNATLWIERGTVIRFEQGRGLNIYGRLDAVGSPGVPITFTLSSSIFGKGSWQGITFYDSSQDTSLIEHAVLQYVSRGVRCVAANPAIQNCTLVNSYAGFDLVDASPSIVGCTVQRVDGTAISANGRCSPAITGNHIAECANGISIHLSSGTNNNPIIRNNIIRNNRQYGISVIAADSNSRTNISFNTIQGNRYEGIYISVSGGILSSNIITSNGCGIEGYGSSNCSLTFNNVWGNRTNYSRISAGASDLSVDPLYIDPERGDLRLQAESPLLSTGEAGGEIGAYGDKGNPPLIMHRTMTSPTTSGSLIQDEIWCGTIEIKATVTVPTGYTLSIEPGTILEFPVGASLEVNGRLDAFGTAEAPITFTSVDPALGNWSGIRFQSLEGAGDDAGTVHYAIIEYANEALSCSGANPTIRHCIFSDDTIGVRLGGASPSIAGCTFSDCVYGILLGDFCTPEIAGNRITGCQYGIKGEYQRNEPVIRNNVIAENSTCGIALSRFDSPTILFNTIHANGTGIYLAEYSDPKAISSNIVSANVYGLYWAGYEPDIKTCNLGANDLWNNGTPYYKVVPGDTDISSDPLFVSLEDFHLLPGSPCIDGGDPFRLDEDGTRSDMGAYGGLGDPVPDPGNSRPDDPSPLSPADSATELSPSLLLEATPFSDPDTDDSHTRSQWQIREADGTYAAPVYESSDTASALTALEIPWGILAPGATYSWHVRYQDNRNGWSEYSPEVSFTTRSDPDPPDTVILSGPGEGEIVPSSVLLTWSGTDAYGGPLSYSYTMDESEGSAFTPGTSHRFSGLSDGSHTFAVMARDYSGNLDPTPVVRHFAVDATAPLIGNMAFPKITNESAEVSWVTSEPASSHIEYGTSTDYGSFTPLDRSLVTVHTAALASLTANTVYHFVIKSMDAFGNEAVSQDLTFRTRQLPDNTPPETSIVQGPQEGALLNTSQVTLIWTGSDDLSETAALSFACRLDSMPWSSFAVETSRTFTALAEGPHTIAIQARDEAGNEDPTPAVIGFSIDTTPPDPVSGFSTQTTPSGAVLQWTLSPSEDVLSYRLYWDNGSGTIDYATPYATIPHPANAATVTFPSKGIYTFGLRAVDRAGNEEKNTQVVVSVDFSLPDAPTLNPVVSPTDASPQTLSGTKEAGTSLWVNGVEAVPLNGSTSWSHAVSLIEGVNSFELFCRNEAGKQSPSITATIDYEVPPPAVATLKASGEGPGTTVFLSWAGYEEPSDIASYRVYALDHSFIQVLGLSPSAELPAGTFTFTVAKLTKGAPYYFAVVAVDTRGNALNTVTPVWATPTDTVSPEPVSALKVQCFSDRLLFTWSGSANSGGDLSGYNVYFNGSTEPVSLDKSAASFEATGLSPATLYPFRVSSVDTSGNESTGVSLNGVTLLENPTGLSAEPFNARIGLSWTAAEPGVLVSYYLVYVSEVNFTSVSGLSPRVKVTGTTASISGLTNDKRYFCAVTAVNLSGGERKEVSTVSVTPRGDLEGPKISDVRFDTVPLSDGTPISRSGTFSLSATDPSGVSRVEFRIDSTLIRTATAPRYSALWDPAGVLDGIHTLTLTAIDTLGNAASLSFTLDIALSPPGTPTLTQPSTGKLVNTPAIAVSGRSDPNVEILFFINGASSGQPALSDSNGNFSSTLSLLEGENRIQAAAQNRSGVSALSPPVVVTLDSSLPQSPTGLTADSKPGGMIGLSWRAPLESSLKGYNLYRASGPFTSPSGAVKVNGAPLTQTHFDDLPAADGTYTYRVSSVDAAGNESELCEPATADSDRAAPQALSIEYAPSGPFDPSTGRMGPGLVGVSVTLSEPVQSAPFLSLTPHGGMPISIELEKASETRYAGTLSLASSTPSGRAYAVFSARDRVGNRGTEIGAGATLEIDTAGPSVVSLTLSPHSPILNDAESPVLVTVTLGVSEALKPGILPELSFLLSKPGRTAVALTNLHAVSTGAGEAQRFEGTLALPSDGGSPEPETLQFFYEGRDDLENVGKAIVCPNRFQVYQGDLPPLDAPEGLKAKSLPGGRIELTWYPTENASGYEFYRKAPGETALSFFKRVGSVAQLIDSPALDGTYAYAIASLRSENGQEAVSAMSEPVEASSDSIAPSPPRSLSLELISQGANASWQPPLETSEPVTYSLYRADLPEILSFEGLTPILHGVKETTVLDPHPSPTDHAYAVAAVDEAGNISEPSNSVYLNCKLLPVASLKVVQTEGSSPVLSWTHPGGISSAVSGFNVTLGSGEGAVKLNSAPLTGLSFTDSGYAGDERAYTVTAVDDNGVESLGRSITLPILSARMKPGESLLKGVMNRLDYLVQNASGSALEPVRLKAKAGSHLHTSEEFRIEAGEEKTVSVAVGGYADLPATVPLVTTLAIASQETELVEMSRTATIAAGDGMLILGVLNEELTRGTSGKVQFTLENTGEEEIEIITATNSGASASQEITFKLLDTDGNVITSVPFRQSLGVNIVALANGKTVARIPVGAVFTSASIDLPVPLSAPDEAVVELAIAKIYYHQGKVEEVAMQGFSTRHPVSFVDTAYYGKISGVDPEVSNGDRDIVIAGDAIERASGLPQPQVPLNLVITLNGFERSREVMTGADGSFSYTYTPSATECGVFKLRAVHPDIKDKPVQAQFTINRVTIVPQSLALEMPRNYEQKIPIRVSASEGTTVRNLRVVFEPSDQPEGTAPQGVHVNSGSPLSVLSSGQAAELPVSLWADNTAPAESKLVFEVRSDEKASWATVTVNLTLNEAKPVLAFTPHHIETGVSFGDVVTEALTLENKGFAPMTDVGLSIASKDGSGLPDWVHLNAESSQGSLGIGEKRSVPLSFSPIEGAVLEGNYAFVLRVTSSNHPTTDIGVYVAVTQSGTGQAIFKISDIYTGTLDATGSIVQGLKGAAIKLQNEMVPTIQRSGVSDDRGELYLPELPAGRYQYLVSAPNHQDRTGRIWVKAGVGTSESVLLEYNLITVEWEVKETTVEDKYEIVLKLTYETDVPAPVLVAKPASVYLPEMAPGDVYYGEFTLTNFGLIQALNLQSKLFPSSDDYFSYELGAELPASLEAKESVTLPYRVTCLKSARSGDQGGGGGGGTCLRYAKLGAITYVYECASGTLLDGLSPLAFFYDNGKCGGASGSVVNEGGGDGGNGEPWRWKIVPEWGANGMTGSPSAAPLNGAKCLPRPERKEALTGEVSSCLIDTLQDVIVPVGSAVNCALREYTDKVTDLRVKAPGGKIELTRYYYGNRWRWGFESSNLRISLDDQGKVGTLDKGGVVYERSSANSPEPLFLHDTYRITQVDSGFVWTDKYGTWKSYDSDGRLTAYGTPGGVAAKLLYEPNGANRAVGIADRNGRQVFWFEYEGYLLTAVHDLENRRVEYTYSQGKLSAVKDVLGNTTTYQYDDSERLVKKTDPEGRLVSISYNPYGYVAGVSGMSGGYSFEFDYDSGRSEYYAKIGMNSGMIKEVWFDWQGGTKQVKINGRTVRKIAKDNRNLLITDERGNTTRKEFDEWKNLTKVVYPDGSRVTHTYEHAFNRRTSTTDERGTVSEYSYDGAAHLVSTLEARDTSVQRKTRYTYDANENLLTVERLADALTPGALTLMDYDEAGNLSALQDPEQNTTTFTHDVMGNVLSVTDARGKVWTYTYDAAGKMASATDPLGHTTTMEYDMTGNKTKEFDAEGRGTTYLYDNRNHVVSSTDSGGGITTYEYDPGGKLTRVTDPEAKSFEYRYDTQGRLAAAVDGNGNEVAVEYEDAGGGCASCSRPLDKPSRIVFPTFSREFNYNARGRMIEQRDVLNDTESHVSTFGYDAAGNPTSVTDREGKSTLYAYDELNRLIKTTDPTSHDTLYAFDSRDNLIALTDANGNTTRFDYDRNNRQVKETRPLGQATVYRYDAVGDLIGKTDAKSQLVQYGNDDARRLVEILTYSASDHSAPVKTVRFSLDNVGHLLGYEDGETNARYEYDDAYRKIAETVNLGPFELSSTTAWYANGTKKSFTGPDGVTYGYTYDAGNQSTSIEIPGTGFITHKAYTWFLPASISIPGGGTKEIVYDPLMRLKEIQVKDPGQNVLMSRGYTYNKMDRITGMATEKGDHTYTYDDLYRLVGADHPTIEDEAYSYDPVGNRLSSAKTPGEWVYNGNNELLSYDTVSFVYDPNGNRTEEAAGSGARHFLYDEENRLVRVEDGSGGTAATYGYDPFGRRLWKEVRGNRTYFAYSDEGLIGEYDSAGSQTKAYGYRPGSTWTTDPLFMKEGTNYYFYQNDHLGTPVQLTALDGSVVWSSTVDSFCETSVDSGARITNSLRFAGQNYDQETGLNYNWHRYYDPKEGRYLTPDPIGLIVGLNPYPYVQNDPINLADAWGLVPGKPYSNIIETGIIAVQEANPRSIGEGIEYAGLVYKYNDSYYHTKGYPGGEGWSCPLDALEDVPIDALVLGGFHTHGRYIISTDNDFSYPNDYQRANKLANSNNVYETRLIAGKYVSFLGTPNNRIKLYIAVRGELSVTKSIDITYLFK